MGGEKGGTGKTTFAVNFAVMRMKEMGDVILVDAESTQPNASNWCVLRDTNEVAPRIPSVQKIGKNMRSDIIALKKKYTDIVIDTGGQDTIELRSGLLVADIAVSPLKPSQFDMWTLANLDKLVGEVKTMNERLKFLVFLNQASTNPQVSEIDDAKKYFIEGGFEHIQLASSVVRERIAFRKMASSGRAIVELGIDAKAESEMNALYKEATDGQA